MGRSECPSTTMLAGENPVSKVLELFKYLKAGTPLDPNPWTVTQLNEGDYEYVESQLQKDEPLWRYVSDKIRRDYNPSTRKLVVRMPTFIHEKFLASVVEGIIMQLRNIQECAGIEPQGSSEMWLKCDRENYNGRDLTMRCPDMAFGRSGALFPGVVIEVAYSQKMGDLHTLADDYILGSNGKIKVVIGLNIEYNATKRATISMWRPQYIYNDGQVELWAGQTVENEVFRNDDGSPRQNGGLMLRLRDLDPNHLAHSVNLSEVVRIPSRDLCHYLDEAEQMHQHRKTYRATLLEPQSGLIKRWRSITPPEEINPEHESKYFTQEKTAIDLRDAEDHDYEPVPK